MRISPKNEKVLDDEHFPICNPKMMQAVSHGWNTLSVSLLFIAEKIEPPDCYREVKSRQI